MKQKFLSLLVGIAAATSFLPACQKNLGNTDDNTIPGTPLPGQPIYCRIESIWENPGGPSEKFRLILYDQYENPTMITTPMVATGNPLRTFKYDTWHRLIQYREEFGNGSFNAWHFYGFDNYGRIGVDTAYYMGSMMTGMPTGYSRKVISWFEYDSQNRIIKSVNVSDVGPSPTFDIYTYNSSGNLMSGSAVYDNKINIHRTNDIWMFLARNYSVNNPFTASSYNTTGFPTIINTPTFFRFANGDELIWNHAQIGYSCRTAAW